MNSDSPARIAVIGAGWWATDTHIPALVANPDAEIVALCDADPARLQAAIGQYDIGGVYAVPEAMLEREEIDGVVVVSTNASHYAVTKACLERGLHVMVEKPMTLFAPQARELAELAQAQSVELIVGYPFNFTPYAIRAKEVIASAELGPVQFINLVYNSYMTNLFSGVQRWNYTVHGPAQYTRPEQTGGGHGQVQITHAAGLLFHVTDLRPQRVLGLMANHQFGVDLVDAMTVQFENGALGTVSGSGNYQGLTFRLQIGCENGWIDMDACQGQAVIHRNDHPEDETITDIERAHPLGWTTSQNLVDVVLGRGANGSVADVGVRAVELLDAGYRSARAEGAGVEIETLYA